MEKQKVKDEIAACFGKKNWLVKVLPIAYCAIGVLLMTADQAWRSGLDQDLPR